MSSEAIVKLYNDAKSDLDRISNERRVNGLMNRGVRIIEADLSPYSAHSKSSPAVNAGIYSHYDTPQTYRGIRTETASNSRARNSTTATYPVRSSYSTTATTSPHIVENRTSSSPYSSARQEEPDLHMMSQQFSDLGYYRDFEELGYRGVLGHPASVIGVFKILQDKVKYAEKERRLAIEERDELKRSIAQQEYSREHRKENPMDNDLKIQFLDIKKCCDDLQDSRRQLEFQHINLQNAYTVTQQVILSDREVLRSGEAELSDLRSAQELMKMTNNRLQEEIDIIEDRCVRTKKKHNSHSGAKEYSSASRKVAKARSALVRMRSEIEGVQARCAVVKRYGASVLSINVNLDGRLKAAAANSKHIRELAGKMTPPRYTWPKELPHDCVVEVVSEVVSDTGFYENRTLLANAAKEAVSFYVSNYPSLSNDSDSLRNGTGSRNRRGGDRSSGECGELRTIHRGVTTDEDRDRYREVDVYSDRGKRERDVVRDDESECDEYDGREEEEEEEEESHSDDDGYDNGNNSNSDEINEEQNKPKMNREEYYNMIHSDDVDESSSVDQNSDRDKNENLHENEKEKEDEEYSRTFLSDGNSSREYPSVRARSDDNKKNIHRNDSGGNHARYNLQAAYRDLTHDPNDVSRLRGTFSKNVIPKEEFFRKSLSRRNCIVREIEREKSEGDRDRDRDRGRDRGSGEGEGEGVLGEEGIGRTFATGTRLGVRGRSRDKKKNENRNREGGSRDSRLRTRSPSYYHSPLGTGNYYPLRTSVSPLRTLPPNVPMDLTERNATSLTYIVPDTALNHKKALNQAVGTVVSNFFR